MEMMKKAASVFDEAKYVRLLKKTVPVKIQTEEEYERILAQVHFLMDKDEGALSVEEIRLLDLLGVLVEQYEEEHYPIDEGSPLATLKFLMEEHRLKPKDIWSLFGSKGITSEVLNGKRAISKAQAKKLAERFGVTADLFI
ncbi:MAG: type II toxin-antitoxin system HigA family antitoxin [Candidatus Binatia bacterium]